MTQSLGSVLRREVQRPSGFIACVMLAFGVTIALPSGVAAYFDSRDGSHYMDALGVFGSAMTPFVLWTGVLFMSVRICEAERVGRLRLAFVTLMWLCIVALFLGHGMGYWQSVRHPL